MLLLTLIIGASILASNMQAVSSIGDPILIVPGITGSQLDVRDSRFGLCNTLGTEFELWASEARILKFGCFSPEIMLRFDKTSGQYSSTSPDDIKITVPGFGDTRTVEKLSLVPYFAEFVDFFVARGYERGKDIRAAPYDWRVAPLELQRRGYYDRLKDLIQTMYQKNGNTKVTIVAHSMGGPTVLFFLTSGIVTQEWKDMYIGNFITLSGAWSGGNVALEAEISGLNALNERSDDMFYIFNFVGRTVRNKLRPILRTLQSIPFLFPRPSVWGNEVLVSTPTQQYTANDYQKLFSDINFPQGYKMFQGIENINQDFPAPNVPTHCYYGVGVDTPESFRYSGSFPEAADDVPEVKMGDGDGTVNVWSSEVCRQWANSNSRSFEVMTFDNVDHLQIVADENVLQEIAEVVGAPSNPVRRSFVDNILKKVGLGKK